MRPRSPSMPAPGADEVLGIHICKNLFLCNAQKTKFYLLLMPGHKKFKTKVLSKQIGSARLSFADDDHMKEYLSLTPGSVSIMGLMNDPENHVKLLIDSDVLKDEYFGCHPCINTTSMKLKTSDIIEKFLPAVPSRADDRGSSMGRIKQSFSTNHRNYQFSHSLNHL